MSYQSYNHEPFTCSLDMKNKTVRIIDVQHRKFHQWQLKEGVK